MTRTTSLPTLIASIGTLAGLAALGAALIVSPGAASPLPTTVQAAKVAPATLVKAEAVARRAEVAKPATTPVAVDAASVDTSAEPRRTVRVVYVGPITGK
ncbi:MAG TPA: hypothetical protein VIL65_13675 [Beijerinckiaceae bacterium]|jgi:hypothetical protein